MLPPCTGQVGFVTVASLVLTVTFPMASGGFDFGLLQKCPGRLEAVDYSRFGRRCSEYIPLILISKGDDIALNSSTPKRQTAEAG